MAVVIGAAGRRARRRAWVDRLSLPVALILMSAVTVGALTWNSRLSASQRTLGLYVIGVELVFFSWRDRAWYLEMFRDMIGSRFWMRGAEGERRVGECLAGLPDEYVVFHDYRPVDDEGHPQPWNVDHVVVGPTGVFVIETKMYTTERVLPASREHSTERNVRQVSRAALELKDRLILWSGGTLKGTFVEAFLVYAQDNAFVENMREGSTQVLPLRHLIKNIVARTRSDLTLEQACRVARALAATLNDDQRRQYAVALEQLDRLYARSRRPVATPDGDPQDESMVPSDCPYCGAPLTRRVAKRGQRKGKPFLGCSQWGQTGCNYIFNLEE